jgi:cupin superfamily protein
VLHEAFAEGDTIAIGSLQHCWLPIARLARAVAEWLQASVDVVLFLTPSGNQGFARHYDDAELFILQIDGEKHPVTAGTLATGEIVLGQQRRVRPIEPGACSLPDGVGHRRTC